MPLRREAPVAPLVENFTTIDWLALDREGSSPAPGRWAASSARSTTHQEDLDSRRYPPSDAHSGQDGDVFFVVGGTVSYCLEASQPWVAAAVVGIICGVVASAVEVVTHWLTDLKLGYCTFNWWASEYLCCLHDPRRSGGGGGAASGCDSFVYWSDWLQASSVAAWSEMGIYVVLSTLLAVLSSWLCCAYAPYAAGSGIVEIKTILSGIRIQDYLSLRVLCIKCIGLCAAVGSGLSLGKEGPFVHVGCCVGAVVGRWFPLYRNSETASRELISASAAAGVAVAFGAPIGGVLFSLEEVSYFFPHRTMIQAFFAAIISTLVLKKLDATHTGHIVLFSVSYRHEFHWFELSSFALIGVVGGIVGATINRLNAMWCHVRSRSRMQLHPVREVLVLAVITAALNFLLPVLRGGMLDTLAELFDDCSTSTSGWSSLLCREDETFVVLQLIAAVTIRTVLTSLTFGCKVPAGCFVPSLFIGACFGRAIGLWTKAVVVQHHATSEILQLSCGPDASGCIVPGVYAIVGAAAVLAGVTRMTVCLVVIMFELTGGLEYVVPCMLVAITSKWIAELLGVPSIYEISLDQKGYPYLDTKAECTHSITVRGMLLRRHRTDAGSGARPRTARPSRARSRGSTHSNIGVEEEAPNAAALQRHAASACGTGGGGVTTTSTTQRAVTVVWNGMRVSVLSALVADHTFQWFPVVEALSSSLFVGCVSRAGLQRQLCLHQSRLQVAGDAASDASECVFFSHAVAAANAGRCVQLDWSHLVDNCTVQASLEMPVSKLLHVFKALGNQHVVVVDGGRLVDVVTRKDMVLFLRSVREEGGARGSLMRWMGRGR